MLKAIITYLEAFSRAKIVSRSLDMDRLGQDENYRREIVAYLGETDHVTPTDEIDTKVTTYFDWPQAA